MRTSSKPIVTTRLDTSDALARLRASVRSITAPRRGAATSSTKARLSGAGQPQSNRTCQ